MPGNPKFVIKKGMMVLIPVLGIHMDPELYPNPEIFDPERFTPDMVRQRDPMNWLGFGEGPRICIGMRFGKMKTCLGLACAIRNFRFTVCSKTDFPLVFNPIPFIVTTKNKIYLNVESLRNK